MIDVTALTIVDYSVAFVLFISAVFATLRGMTREFLGLLGWGGLGLQGRRRWQGVLVAEMGLPMRGQGSGLGVGVTIRRMAVRALGTVAASHSAWVGCFFFGALACAKPNWLASVDSVRGASSSGFE